MKKNILKKIMIITMILSTISGMFMLSGCGNQAKTHGDKILKAIDDNNVEELKLLLSDAEQTQKVFKEGITGNYEAKEGGLWDKTPLGYAAYCGNEEAVKLLVESGADINQQSDYCNFTPLYAAIDSPSENKFEIANYLLDNGADIHMCIQDDNPYNSESILGFFIAENGFSTTDEALIQQGNTFFVRCMEMGASVNEVSDRGHLLLDACEFGNNLSIVKYMVESLHCDVNMQINGWTPLMVASYGWGHYNEAEIVKYLLEQGADTTQENANGETAYELAVRMDNRDIMAILEPLEGTGR